MEFCTFHASALDPVLATAVHNGHDLRPDIAAVIALDEATRLREEDPYTGWVASRFETRAVVHRSRFEVDLNREPDRAVYRSPQDAWDLAVWDRPLTEVQVAESMRLYERFYAELASILDNLLSKFGGFILYDIHSYNHRRAGPDARPGPVADNPTVNLGTRSLPERWKPVADTFVEVVRRSTLDGDALDVRENVRFEGGHLARWVHERYGDSGFALPIELKKVFMDEWTGKLDAGQLDQLGDALVSSVDPVRKAFELA